MTDMLALIQQHPLLGILLTLATIAAATALWRRLGQPALLHPVLLATIAVAAFLLVTRTSYETYLKQAFLLNEALAVVIVLLAVPLVRQAALIARAGLPLSACLAAGSAVAIATALLLPTLVGASEDILATLAPKSATAAVAVQVAERLGGVAGLTAVVVISTGIFGAVCGPGLLAAAGVDDDRAKGFALGLASHAIGTARAFQISEIAGAFATIGMILNALLTMALVPMAMLLLAQAT